MSESLERHIARVRRTTGKDRLKVLVATELVLKEHLVSDSEDQHAIAETTAALADVQAEIEREIDGLFATRRRRGR